MCIGIKKDVASNEFSENACINLFINGCLVLHCNNRPINDTFGEALTIYHIFLNILWEQTVNNA